MRGAAIPVLASIPVALWVQRHTVFLPPGLDPAWLEERGSKPLSLPVGGRGLLAGHGTIKRAEKGHFIALLMASGRLIIDALIRPTGTLFMFSTGEQCYTSALRLGQDDLPTARLAEIANEAGYGDLEELLENYTAMSPDFEGRLPDFRPDGDL